MRGLFSLILSLALLLSACSAGSETGSTETPAPSQEIRTTEAGSTAEPIETAAAASQSSSASSGTAEASQNTETEETPAETADSTLPKVSIDPESKTLSVSGTEKYTALVIPAEAASLYTLKVEDDDFSLTANLSVLRSAGLDLTNDLPALLERTDQSLRFLKTYLSENAGSAYPAGQAGKRVTISLGNTAVNFENTESGIRIRDSVSFMHREFYYLLALMQTEEIGWEQFGYAWYLGTCVDPYSEFLPQLPGLKDAPYYSLMTGSGFDPENVSPADVLTAYDAVSRLCFVHGLTYWGSTCESRPVTAEPDYKREKTDPGDTGLSAFMAASFLGWLEKESGFETVSRFCFGQLSFEEAFGRDFESAFDAWKSWITENYPM